MVSAIRNFARDHSLLAAMGLIPVLFLGLWLVVFLWTLSAPARGWAIARFDVARGHYEVQEIGLAAPWRPQSATLLRERYGVEHRRVAGCVVTESLNSYVAAYNGVMRAAAQRKFGHDVFAECSDDARKAFGKSSDSQ
jgi:hypothetical protein